ncbi:MAG: hypothetical protein AAGF73_04050 [Actinomycetota bacterium]
MGTASGSICSDHFKRTTSLGPAAVDTAAVADPTVRRANPTVNVLIDEASFEAAMYGDRVHPSAYRDITGHTT